MGIVRKRSQVKEEESRKKTGEATVRVPHDSVNEMVLIAAVLQDESARKKYLSTLSPDFFYGNGHSVIWSSLQEIDRKGLEYNPMTLKQIGGDVDIKYVESLIEQRPVTPKNLSHHVEMLMWDNSRISTARGALTTFLALLKDPKSDPLATRVAAKQIETSLAVGNNQSLRNPNQLIDEQMRSIRKRRDGHATFGFGIEGLDTYTRGDTAIVDGRLTDLNGKPRLVPGTAPGYVTVVTGVSGSGKTTATTRGVLGIYHDNRRVAYGAYEQGSGMSLELLAAMELGMSRTDLMTGRFDDEDESDLRSTMEQISERVVFDEIPFNNFDERKAKFQNQRAIDRIARSIIDSKCDVYVADLFRRTMGEMDPADEERALYRMQEMAKSLNVHLILVQQQNAKQVEASKHKLPSRETIKGSGAWVEIADQIIAWYRPALYKNVPDDRIYSLILKQRYGKWPQMIEHLWEPVHGTIEAGKTVDMKFGEDAEDGSVDSFMNPGSKKK